MELLVITSVFSLVNLFGVQVASDQYPIEQEVIIEEINTEIQDVSKEQKPASLLELFQARKPANEKNEDEA